MEEICSIDDKIREDPNKEDEQYKEKQFCSNNLAMQLKKIKDVSS